ncbi:DENN domain-containing protein 1B isoform X2 [Corythoichthys intestinalis]|uniref:DENN domain-containing protein 1B isoform X2 n=1 Tax=Corythoichthys intestinalis TaxID=161448 RepID=UPI0025A66F6A|nr:DENN domain-containing protein 1B isoform X2 [Corythoichthys intestinalis]
MGSRLRKNPERPFNVFFEATCPVNKDKDPGVRLQFPEDFGDEESCQTLSKFCFPYDIQRAREGVAVQHFTFVLTDLEGCQRFGFCRLTGSTQTCLCILSHLPWFEVFYKYLNTLADHIKREQTNEMKAILTALYKEPMPLTAESITLQMIPYFVAPDSRSLPSIPENRNLTELIVAVDVTNLLQLYASMLFERRILIFACKLSTLTSCVHALGALLYPMHWQHIFIPVLPPHLLDYCCAPMPYLIGVHSSLAEVRSRGLEEVVVLNVDTNTLENPFNDLKKIPSDVASELKLCLKRQAVSAGCGVSQAFLKAQSALFGGYKDALQNQKGGEICFNKDLFLEHKSPSMRQFLQSAIHLQFFKQFIDGRLDILKTGKVPGDLFEEEILNCETTGKNKSYQQLVGNLKKGGGALILNMKSKTNIRMNNFCVFQTKGIKSRLKNKALNETHAIQRGESVSYHCAQSDCLQNRLPITRHYGMPRPRRPGHQLSGTRGKSTTTGGDTWNSETSEQVVKLEKDKEQEEEESMLCDLEEMDLLGEIFDTLSTRSSLDRGLLYGTRSLDLFGPDSDDYITKIGQVNPSQESLLLSTCDSDSLHSWNPDQSDEVVTLTNNSNLPLHPNKTDIDKLPEQEVLESAEDKQEESKVAIDVNHSVEILNKCSSKEVMCEPENWKFETENVTLNHGPLKETTEQHEDEELKITDCSENASRNPGQHDQITTAEIQKDATAERSKNIGQESEEVGHQNLFEINDVQICQSCDSKTYFDANSYIKHEVGSPTPVKVSELKKRFEAQWSDHTG